jgi:hypothetical protein
MEAFLKDNNITAFNTPSVLTVLGSYTKEYDSLISIINEEKKKEATPTEHCFNHKLVDFIEVDDSTIENMVKIGTPVTILKIASPYKEITKDNLNILLGSSYPRKWLDKDHTDLYLFRKIFMDMANSEIVPKLDYCISQQSSIDLIHKLKRISSASTESSVIINFATKVMNQELRALELNMLGTKERKDIVVEVTEDGARNYWILDVFEHLNKNIIMNASAKHNRKELEQNILYYEGKRINTTYFSSGASISKIEFEYHDIYLVVFISKTICSL